MNVLFVCEGDTCLGPMASGLLRNAVARQDEAELHVESAGLCVFDDAASPGAVETMKKLDIDLGHHKPKAVSQELVQWADLILTMTGGQLRQIRGAFPEANGKSFRIAGYVGVPDDKLSDPYGSTMSVYKEVLKVLIISLIKLAPKIGLAPNCVPRVGRTPESMSKLSPETCPLQKWYYGPPKAAKLPERGIGTASYYIAAKSFSARGRYVEEGYEAQHRLQTADFGTLDEYRYLQEVAARGKYAQEELNLGGNPLPKNPYEDEGREGPGD